MKLQQYDRTHVLLMFFLFLARAFVRADEQFRRLTVRAIRWVVRRPRGAVGHKTPVEGVRLALGAAGGSRRRARVRRQGVVTQVGRRRVGVQGERLLQAAHRGAVSAGEGQALVPRVAALRGAAGVILLAQVRRQAVGIPRPAAGKARVEPRPLGLAGKRSGLTVRSRVAVRPVGAVARAGLGESAAAWASPLCVRPHRAEQGAVGGGGVLWSASVAFWGGVPGFSLREAHGLIVLLGRVEVAARVSAQLTDVTVGQEETS